VLSFEAEHERRLDPGYCGSAVECYAAGLRGRFRTAALAAAGTDAAPFSASVDAEQALRRGNSMVPIPPGVADIDDYPPGGK
jgi:hypothetical protein